MKNIPLYDVRSIINLKDMINSSVEIYSDKTAFLSKNKSSNNNYFPITYKQLKHDMDAMGTALLNLGLKNKRVAIIAENRYEWAISYLAVLNGTGIVIPLDKELPQNEIENLLKRSKANAIIFSKSILSQIQEIVKS
ncbi:MAG TPA: AMP-binding protein, partial [Clostridiaceae bacterium]|nr:AMP-binding protein [Clostridiaceae bacterium]